MEGRKEVKGRKKERRKVDHEGRRRRKEVKSRKEGRKEGGKTNKSEG